MRSVGDRVALVRHRARALLAGAERLLDLAHLGALQVADLLREALQPGAGERDRAAAARRGGRAGRPGWRPARPRARAARAPARSKSGPERRVGADRAGDRAGRRLRERALQPLGVAVRLDREAGELEPERGRLGVDAVGAADAQRVRRARAPARRAPRPARARAGTITSPARRSCSASAVSSTSDEVSPKWIQRPAGPADAPSTSTNAATSWSVTASRSFTASTVNVAPRIASRSPRWARRAPRRRRPPRRARRSSGPRRSRCARARGGCSARSRVSRMRAASTAALRALSTPTQATGTPGGICAIESSASSPPATDLDDVSGTPMTGSAVWAATTPGSAADRPAPAMITRRPRSCAFLA